MSETEIFEMINLLIKKKRLFGYLPRDDEKRLRELKIKLRGGS